MGEVGGGEGRPSSSPLQFIAIFPHSCVRLTAAKPRQMTVLTSGHAIPPQPSGKLNGRSTLSEVPPTTVSSLQGIRGIMTSAQMWLPHPAQPAAGSTWAEVRPAAHGQTPTANRPPPAFGHGSTVGRDTQEPVYALLSVLAWRSSGGCRCLSERPPPVREVSHSEELAATAAALKILSKIVLLQGAKQWLFISARW